MKKQRLISALLILAMLASSASLFSCSESTENSDPVAEETAATPSAEEETVAETEAPKDSLEARLDVSDELPDKQFDGRTFAIIAEDQYEEFYISEELIGEAINDAVYARNLAVTERFDVKLDSVFHAEGNLAAQAKLAVNAGDDAYQLVTGHIIYLGQSVKDGYMYNLNKIPHLNFDQPWWSDSTVEDLTYNGKTYLGIGDMLVSAVASTCCMLFNKNLAEAYGIPEMYDVVREGAWTIDKLYELSEGIYADTNGNGERDEEDTWAFATESKDAVNAYLWAFGKKIMTTGDDGKLTMDGFYDEKYVDIVEKLYDLFIDSGLTYTNTTNWGIGRDTFLLGNTLFANVYVSQTLALRDSEIEYGVIPYPKWDEAQTEYATNVVGGHEGLAVLTSIKDPEFVGIVTEALCAESWKQVIPAYYDTTIKYKGARDEESIAMLDLIMDSRIFDFGYVYGGWGCAFWLQYCMEQQTKDIASMHKSKIKAIEKQTEKLFEYFAE